MTGFLLFDRPGFTSDLVNHILGYLEGSSRAMIPRWNRDEASMALGFTDAFRFRRAIT